MTGPDKNTLQYKENTIASARPEELPLMMYNGLMKFIARAQEEIRTKSLEAAHNTLIRCQDIVFEFQYALNMDYSVSNNLMLLYDYLYNRLIEANAKKDCAILDEVSEFVTGLRDTWMEAVKQSKDQKSEAREAFDALRAGPEPPQAGAEAPGLTGGEVTEVKIPGASMRIGSGEPKRSSTKAIYKRAGPPQFADGITIRGSGETGLGNIMASVLTRDIETKPPCDTEIISGIDETALPGAADISSQNGAAPPPVPGSPLKRYSPVAAAQYAKVAKAKTPPSVIISIASE